MRIAVDVRCLLETYRTGVGEYTYQVLKRLPALAPQHQWVLFANAADRQRWYNLPSDIAGPNVERRFSGYPNKLFNLSRFTHWPKADRLIGGADLFWMPNEGYLALSRDVPLAFTVHDLSAELYPQFFSAYTRLWHRFIGRAQWLKRTNLVLAVSEQTKRDIVRLHQVPPERIAVTPEGVEAPGERPPRPSYLPEHYLLLVGNVEPRKNIPAAVAALEAALDNPEVRKNYPHLRLLIAGPLGWRYRPILERIRNSPWSHRIQILGYCTPDLKERLYENALALLYLPFYEGFGIPPLEAMARRCPVLLSTAPPLAEHFGEAGAMVNPYDQAQAGQVLTELMLNDPWREYLKTRGLALAQRYTWDRCAEATWGAMQTLLTN